MPETDSRVDDKTIKKKKETISTEKVNRKHQRIVSEFYQTEGKFTPQFS